MDDLDAETLSRALKQHGLGELLSFAPILRGNWRQNSAVETTSGRFVFRCRPLFEGQFQREAQAVAFLSGDGRVAVPSPYLLDESKTVFPWEYAVMPLLRGVPVEVEAVTPDNHLALAQATGELLAYLHGLPVDLDNFPLLAGREKSTPGLLSGAEENIEKCRARDFLTATEARAIKSKLRVWSEELPATFRPSFIHGDFQLNNLLVSGADATQIVGLLDFSTSHFGHPAQDLPRQLCGFLDLDPSRALPRAFLAGYRNAGPRDLDALPFFLLCERLDLWMFIKDLRVDWVDQSLSFTDWLAPYLEAAERRAAPPPS